MKHTHPHNTIYKHKHILIDPTYKTHGKKNIHNLIGELRQIDKGTWKLVDKKSKENKHKLWACSKEYKY